MSKKIKKHPSKMDRRTKEYKEWVKAEEAKKIQDPALGGTTETIKIEIKGEENLEEERFKMKIYDNIPKNLLDEMLLMQGCECVIDAYYTFMDTPFRVTVKLQDAINEAYTEFFNERLRRTTCSTCMKRRIKRVRDYFEEKIGK